MSPIKYIDYDCSDVDNVLFEKRLETIALSYYRIDKRSLLVNYCGTAKDLYDNIEDIVRDKYMLIIDITNPDYFGYHKSALWDWLKNQFNNSQNR